MRSLFKDHPRQDTILPRIFVLIVLTTTSTSCSSSLAFKAEAEDATISNRIMQQQRQNVLLEIIILFGGGLINKIEMTIVENAMLQLGRSNK
jgi:hypothetical protein